MFKTSTKNRSFRGRNMEILIWFIQNIFTPVILSFVTVIITIYFTKRKEKPVIIEEITKTNNPKKVILKKSKFMLH